MFCVWKRAEYMFEIRENELQSEQLLSLML